MLRVNFSAYNTYVTDSLYQWDKNRVLAISGLNMTIAPEIHFTNVSMERAIVRESTLDDGVVIVRIPNSLLQSRDTIKAYVGLYDGETFKVIEKIEIPIIARTKPQDYTIEVNDEEVYSFRALEKLVNDSVEDMTSRHEVALQEINTMWSELISTTIQVVSFDPESGVLVTKSPDYAKL